MRIISGLLLIFSKSPKIIQLLMDPAFLKELESALKLSMQGDSAASEQSSKLLNEELPKKEGYLSGLFLITVEETVF